MVALAANPASSAGQLDGQQRQALALAALGGESISEMSRTRRQPEVYLSTKRSGNTSACKMLLHLPTTMRKFCSISP